MVEQKRYVDVNVFIYWLGGHTTFGKTAYEWIERIESSSRGAYVTSSLTLYQALVVIAGLTGRNMRDESLVKGVIGAIKSLPGLEVVSLSSEDFERAIELMESYKLDYEDALHLAVALRSKAMEIISNDDDFDKTPLKRRF